MRPGIAGPQDHACPPTLRKTLHDRRSRGARELSRRARHSPRANPMTRAVNCAPCPGSRPDKGLRNRRSGLMECSHDRVSVGPPAPLAEGVDRMADSPHPSGSPSDNRRDLPRQGFAGSMGPTSRHAGWQNREHPNPILMIDGPEKRRAGQQLGRLQRHGPGIIHSPLALANIDIGNPALA